MTAWMWNIISAGCILAPGSKVTDLKVQNTSVATSRLCDRGRNYASTHTVLYCSLDSRRESRRRSSISLWIYSTDATLDLLYVLYDANHSSYIFQEPWESPAVWQQLPDVCHHFPCSLNLALVLRVAVLWFCVYTKIKPGLSVQVIYCMWSAGTLAVLQLRV